MVGVHVTAEAACAAIEGLAGTLPVALLLSRLGLRAEWVIGVEDVVLEAVARALANALLPLLPQPRLVWTLAEGALGPGAGGLNLALGELVADLGVLSRELGQRALQPVALGADLARVAQLACNASALCE